MPSLVNSTTICSLNVIIRRVFVYNASRDLILNNNIFKDVYVIIYNTLLLYDLIKIMTIT